MQGAGRVTGIVVFLFGIALLAFTYFLGYLILTDVERLKEYVNLIPLPQPLIGEELVDAFGITLSKFLSYIIPIVLLFLLGYIASKISYYGIEIWRAKLVTEEKEISKVQA
ncbi:MAG: hypothetical protein QXJ19_03450 [Candidatus Bathyarchaeia archaeon]|nr:hypothetical protein [Candidatus Bathyarchaeota archaeon]